MTRVRFAPSPTGALHIGGIRTALYNYLFAKQQGGTFILRIEDTDQTRFVPGAEDYILRALQWVGLNPDEGPQQGGKYTPYRQSERKSLYGEYAHQLVANGKAYYAFDTESELDAMRQKAKESGQHVAPYDASSRQSMRNSLTLSPQEVNTLLESKTSYIIRLKVEKGQLIHIQDIVRGEVTFNTDELDDKVLLKSDGMPTYHLANVVDDRLMEITHVIRGEEWLPSTAHHVLLYRAFGWENEMPQFAHLPLILKPDGKGKLSKRDGVKLGIPVFPLPWKGETAEESFSGFQDTGFESDAVCNFLAFLGWNDGSENEIFSREELIAAFSLDRIHKSGARFDFEKAKWFNQQYLMQKDPAELAMELLPEAQLKYPDTSIEKLEAIILLVRDRITLRKEILTICPYLFMDPPPPNEADINSKCTPERMQLLSAFAQKLETLTSWNRESLDQTTKELLAETSMKMSDLMPLLRLAIAGTLQGPDILQVMIVIGKSNSTNRILEFKKSILI